MKKLCALLVGALVATVLTVAPAPSATAGTVTASGFPYGTSITLTFPDLQWTDVAGCRFGQVTGSVNGPLFGDYWGFEAAIRLKSNPSIESWAWYYGGDRTGPFVADEAFQVCAKDHPSGVYEVRGTVWMVSDVSDAWASTDVAFTTEFTLSPMATTTTLATPTVIGTMTTFSGRVLATSATRGSIGADPSSQVAIESLSGGAWTRIGVGNPDATGWFAIPVPTVLPPGAAYRASYLGSATCAPSTSAEQVVPTPPVVTPPLPTPIVKVTAVSSRSKLKVDVNPNKGRKYWTFQVQRKNADGTWKALKTYRTLGSSEKRTINLSKGTYRVFVNPKFGYQGVLSAEVTLKR